MVNRKPFFFITLFVSFNLFLVKAVSSPVEGTSSSAQGQGIIIRYHDGQSPEELAQKTRNRLERGNSFFGRMANFGEDVVSAARDYDPPELALQELKKREREAGVVNKRSLVSQQNVLGASSENGKRHPLANIYFADLVSGKSTAKAIETLSQDPRVKYVNPTHRFKASKLPNDPEFNRLWGLDNTADTDIDAPEAWETITSSKAVTVAILDSGINYNHPDLADNTLSSCDGICDFINQDDDPQDDYGHGTFIAGIIGAVGNNNQGITGVNWETTMMPLKVLDSNGEGTEEQILPAIEYAADHGAKIINLSLSVEPENGGPCTDEQTSGWREVINYAHERGVVLVAAAGNNNADAANIIPANCEHVIAVGATNDNDARASFSNYGDVVNISAPGKQIYSTSRTGDPPYGIGSGTSFAAPYVAGAAALMLSKKPDLTPDEIARLLITSADQIQTDQPIGPRLNLNAALKAIDSPPSVTPTPTPTPPLVGDDKIHSVLLSFRLQGIYKRVADRELVIDLNPESVPLEDQGVHRTITFTADDNGVFTALIDLTQENLEPGSYRLQVSTNYHLRRRFSIGLNAGANILNLSADSEALLAGDLDENGITDNADRDILINAYDAFFGVIPSAADLNEDGYINAIDYSILVNNIGCQDDDEPGCGRQPPETPTPTPTATPTPTPTPTATPTPTPTPPGDNIEDEPTRITFHQPPVWNPNELLFPIWVKDLDGLIELELHPGFYAELHGTIDKTTHHCGKTSQPVCDPEQIWTNPEAGYVIEVKAWTTSPREKRSTFFGANNEGYETLAEAQANPYHFQTDTNE